MAALSPAWSVRKGGVDYVTDADNCQIVYRRSNPSEAFMNYNNSDKSLMAVFAEEDEVQIKIGNTIMMDAYIDSITDIRKPSNHFDLKLHLTDFGSYFAAKKSFEKNYLKTVIAANAFSDSAAVIPGLSTNITGLNTSNENIKRDFAGTFVKDIWDEVAQNAGADYFVDENKVLQAFPFGSRDLLAGNGSRYKIQDTTSFAVNQIRARFDNDITFIRDVTGKYRTVIVTNGLDDTNPIDIDSAVTGQTQDSVSLAMVSNYFDSLVPLAAGIAPFKFLPSTDIQGLLSPSLQIICPGPAAVLGFTIGGRTVNGGTYTYSNQNFDLSQWQSLRFIMKNALTGPAVTSIILRLICNGGNWFRDIYPDLIDQNGVRNNYVSLQYGLPVNPAASVSNGWTRQFTPDLKMNHMTMLFSPNSGYNANSYVEFAKFFFYRKVRRNATSAGTPATEKIIVNASMTNPTSLQNFANKELSRVQNTAKKPDFTIDGNTDFRKPGYNIDVDFSSIFDSNRIATAVIMDEIRHKQVAGIHYTDIFLDNSFNRK